MYNKRVNDILAAKLKIIPVTSGVYFHKDASGQIIYIGKAAILKNRIKQYFQNTRDMDVKTRALVAEIADIDWVETDSEIDALFLEAEMVKRYMPRFNILLRDDKSLLFVRIDMKSDWPYVCFTRNPADDGAEYFGPYYNGFAVKKALRYLRRVFPYFNKLPKAVYRPTKLQRSRFSAATKDNAKEIRLDLDAHLGLSPVNMTSDEYKANIRKLISYINGNRKKITVDLQHEMKKAAKLHNFELAAINRNKIRNLNELQQKIMFGDKEFLDISKDLALRDLTDLLGLPSIPVRIEGFDVSHMSGTNVVASMVVFKNGVSDRAQYRKFKTRNEKNDDYNNMSETIIRRFGATNLKNWGVPDLVLIDGGKGQLDAALLAVEKCGHSNIPIIGIAKKLEQIVIRNTLQGDTLQNEKSSAVLNVQKIKDLGGYVTYSDDYVLINLPNSTHIIKLLQRIRDESHRFAVSYHTVLKRAKQTSSRLDNIPGIGPKTRFKLIRKFGSIRGLQGALEPDIIALIGPNKARLVISYIKSTI